MRVVAPKGEEMKVRYLLPALLLAATTSAWAQQDGGRETIVVTATRSEIPLSQATVPVTVIDREQIELSMATDLAELLRFQAGIDIGRNGGPGQAASVFMRGTESNHTLVLVDGVRINPGTIGGAAIQHIDPQVIERIEIVKGTRSALFGTDAIGGVINIITRRATKPYADIGLGAGSFDQRTGVISAGSRGDWGEFGISLNTQDTDGYEIRTTSELERGYDNVTANIYARREFGFGDVTVRHWRASGNVEYLDFFLAPVDQDFLNESTAIELANRFGERGSSKLILSHSRDQIEQNQAIDAVESDRLSLDWQYNLSLDNHLLTAGIFASDEDVDTASTFGAPINEGTDYRAIFLQDSFSSGRHRTFVAARFTDYDSFGSEVTWNAEYGFEVNDRLNLTAGIGHAFRAPDATDRFGFGGDPNLAPEVADEIQLGAEFRATDRQTWRLELYNNDIEDLIEFDLTDFTLRNTAEAEIRGAQLGYEYAGDSFIVKADFVVQSADNAETNERLLRRAEESLSLSYTQRIGRHQLGVSILATGDREDFAETLPSYTLVNLTGQFQLGERWQLNARVENLFDESYETAAGFRMQELSAFAELSYRYR